MNKLRILLNSCGLYFLVAILALPSAFASTTTSNSTQVKASEINEKQDYSLSWSTDLIGERMTDSLSNQKSEFELGLVLSFDMSFSSWMSMNLTPKFVAQNGYIQAPDVVDPTGSRIEIRNASLDLKPSNLFNASLGSLYQRELHSGIFMSKRSFPSLRILSRFGSEKRDNVYLFAESAMPTSSAVSGNSSDMGQTPSLNMAGIGAQLGSEHSNYLVKSFVNTYQFSGLSQDLATSSSLLGNSGVNTSGSNQQFKYGYQGYEAYLEASVRIARPLSLGMVAQGIQNSLAPTDRNIGWALAGFSKYDFSKSLQFEPKFGYYRIESDATVAIYNNNTFNTNREGYESQLKFYYNRKVQLSVRYGERVPIITNPSQPSESYYELELETENAKF